jgi:hypothetical protein
MNHIQLPTRAKRLAIPALVLATPLAWAMESVKFDALMSLGITREAAVAILGAPQRETCSTTVGVRMCRLEWHTGGLLSTATVHCATFLGDRLVAKSTKFNPSTNTCKEQ